MAFARKSKPAVKASYSKSKAPQSYAKRKAAEVEDPIVEEIEEQEEVQDDYQEEQEQEQAQPTRQNRSYGRPAPSGNNYARSNNHGNGNNNGERKALRLTGLFSGKREGLFSGRLRDEDAENLKALIEEAQSSGQQISFFLWENQNEPRFSLTANIAAPKSFGGGFRRGFRR